LGFGLDPFGDYQGAYGRGAGNQASDEFGAAGVVLDAAGDLLVELDDLGIESKDVPQAGEAGPDIVDSDPDASVAGGRKGVAEFGVVVDPGVLRDLEHELFGRGVRDRSAEARGQHRLGRDVHRHVHVAGKRCGRSDRVSDGGQLEIDAQADAVRCVEPGVGRMLGLQKKAGERFDADDAAVLQVNDRLEDQGRLPGIDGELDVFVCDGSS
jgi:hypothetical protein